jgi:hypothetical protein
MSTRVKATRRSVLKGAVALGGAIAGGAVFSPAVHAAKTIKLGYVSPQTGPLAAFAEADDFVIRGFMETVKDGLKIGGETYPVEVTVKDSQSDPNRAAAVAKDLIVQDEVSLMLVASTPETTNPVSTQCEIEEVPCISTVAPWQPYFIGPAGQSRRRTARMEAVQPHLSFLLGSRRRHRRVHQYVGTARDEQSRWAVCFLMTATAMPGATSKSASHRFSTSSATA